MQTAKEKQSTRANNISPKSSRPTTSPSKCLATRQLPQKPPSSRKPASFKIYQAPSSHPPYKIAQKGETTQIRLHTLGDEPFSPFHDDYETPKFNIEKEFKFGQQDKKKEEFFTFGLTKKIVGKEILLARSKGKENSAVSSSILTRELCKDTTFHQSNQPKQQPIKSNSPISTNHPSTVRTITSNIKGKDSISPRKKVF